MRSADEVTLVDAMNGAHLCASTASGAKGVIYRSEISLYLDRAAGTGLLTLHTADTAVRAILTDVSTLVVVGALNDYARGVVDEVNNTVGTLSYTDSAADTLTGIDLSNIVLDKDSVLRAYLCTVAVTEAGKRAEFISTVRHIRGAAALESAEVVSSLYYVTRAVAGNVCNLLYYVLSLNTECFSNTLGGRVTAGNAEISLIGGFFSESLSIAVTARVSARATVCAGQTVTDREVGLVLLDTKEVI